MSFTDDLLAQSAHLLARQEQHPFLIGIGDGSLSEERFRVWLRQDFRYLELYTQGLTLAAERVPDPRDRMTWSSVLQLTLNVEIPQHRDLAARFDLTDRDLETTPVHPTTREYGDFLIEIARTGFQAAILSSHLPCVWDYSHLGRLLMSRGLPADPRYADWITSYAAPEFAELAKRLIGDLNHRAEDLALQPRAEVARIFHRARSFELRFWDMCWETSYQQT